MKNSKNLKNMKKQEYQELMYLSVYGELNEEDQTKLDSYLKKHPELKIELLELKKFRSFVSENTAQKTSDILLNNARTQLREALRKERNKRSFAAQIENMLGEFFQPKLAFGGIGVLALGILIGYCSFSPAGNEHGIIFQQVTNSTETKPKTSITNVRFIDDDASDGEVEFEFDVVAPMHIKGNIDDPEIQKMLTHALLNESNAGVRLSTVDAISRHTGSKTPIDPEIKSALITSLTTDLNPGVRSAALGVLQQYAFDNDIRDAFVHVILKDNNSGLRVAAINGLETAKMDGIKFDDKTIYALKQQIAKEHNNYIRNRAVNLVKEM